MASAPTTKNTITGSLQSTSHNKHDVYFAVSSMRGRRHTQEDTFVIQTELKVHGSTSPEEMLPDHALFAVFDGHGTSYASEYVARHFISTFCNQPSFVEYSSRFLERSKKCNNKLLDRNISLLEDAINSTMLTLDGKLLEEIVSKTNNTDMGNSVNENEGVFEYSDAGTTAIIVILTPRDILCANLGDSRAILQRSRSGTNDSTITLSMDHKPYKESEEARIRRAGGVLLGGKIEARLAVSRALGDFDFKHKLSVFRAAGIFIRENVSGMDDYVTPESQMVSSVPEITVIRREALSDKFLVIASDGIWDVLSNEKCINLLASIFVRRGQSIALACEDLLDQCYTRGSLDNMTAILIRFAPESIGCGDGIMHRRKH